MSKRASYRQGIEFIAMNDEPTDLDAKSIAAYISTSLLADLFGKEPLKVAQDILKIRMRNK